MKLFVFILFFVFILSNVFPCGKKEARNPQPLPATSPDMSAEQVNTGTNNMTKLTGRVQIYGSEPHTFVGIVDENGNEYAVFPPEQEKELRKLQGYLIEFTVIFLDEPQGYGSLFLKGGTVTPVKWEIIR
jgi:hypothetical protein